jgi:Ser/Thr protein kinase RdoA (MazF antagonist)
VDDLSGLARAALERFPAARGRGLDVVAAAESFNSVYAVVDGRRPEFALRVGATTRIHPEGTEEIEAAWTRALECDGFRVATVFDADDGRPLAWQSSPGVLDPRVCMLFAWLDGLPQRLTHAVTFDHDLATHALVADHVLYFQVPFRLDRMRVEHGSLFDDALARAEEVVGALWRDSPHPPHLAHGDLTPANVMVDGELVPIDFQDLVTTHDVHDISITLVGLERFPDAAGLQRAFRAGYETVRRWPDVEPDTLAALIAARHLHVLNFGLGLDRPGFAEWLRLRKAPIIEWMTT